MSKDELKRARELMRDLKRLLDKCASEEGAEDAHQEIQGKFIAAEWEEKAIKSKLANLLIAPEDYYELVDNAEGTEKKEHFTWKEAMALEEKIGNGWRLPTRHEWALICEEFANDENGELSLEKLRKSLALSLSGFVNEDDNLALVGTSGYFWSRTAYDRGSAGRTYGAYCLDLSYSEVYSQGRNRQSYGLTVRMVKELK